MSYLNKITELKNKGFAVINGMYSNDEVNRIIRCIDMAEENGKASIINKNVFAIRQLLKHIPALKKHLFNKNVMALISEYSDSKYFLTKALYFDKPIESNWFVAYHQDLSISVDRKEQVEGYSNWTHKKGQYGVQSPVHILRDTLTVRIHLDDTDENNGALKVIPRSHLYGIVRKESVACNSENEVACQVEKGGVMLMNPLTLHASGRTTNKKQRRVIHLEFNKHLLAEPLRWSEYCPLL